MSKNARIPIRPETVIDFLGKTLPFSLLPPEERGRLAGKVGVDFHPKGTKLLTAGQSRVKALLLVQKGGVKLYVEAEGGEETLVDYRGEGGSLGGLALAGDGLARLSAETVEDTFFYTLAKADFDELVDRRPEVARHFMRAFSKEYVQKALDGLTARGGRRTHETGGAAQSGAAPEVAGGGLYLFSARVGQLVHRPPVTITMGHTIQQCALTMQREMVGSILVEDPSAEVVGIVTDKDLRRVVSVGMDVEAAVEAIMSTPVATISHDASCFDALMRMMQRHIHHLAVEREGGIVGLVTSHDLVVLQGRSPVALFREVLAQTDITGLYPLAAKVPEVVRALVDEGARPRNVTRMITVLNDLLLERMLELLERSLGRPPVPYCWLLMGSEGRREQTFRTDQDNALVYKDVEDETVARACAYYFTAFAERAIEHLVNMGFPRCPGNIMASNPAWRQPFAQWRDQFEDWILKPEPEEVLKATIFFDFRPGFGHTLFADELRNHVVRHASRQDVFLRHLAADCLRARPPLSFFRNFIVEKDGEHKNTLDLKTRGLAPLVDFARVMSLGAGIRATNTLDRLERLKEDEAIPSDLAAETMEAYEFMTQLRLVHQLERAELGLTPDNHIEPARLSDIEKRTLKDAFGVVGRAQSFLKEHFRLNI